MLAVIKREIAAYFRSPIGYIFLAVFYVLSGFAFYTNCLYYRTNNLTPVFESLFNTQLFLIPMLTMRLMSEERKNKTDQALLTAPISLTSMVIGKFLSATLIMLFAQIIVLVYAVVLSFHSTIYWAVYIGSFAAIFLLGMSIVAMGMFISSLTENQVISAIGCFGVSFFLLMLDVLRNVFTNPAAETAIAILSFYDRYQSFSRGIFSYASILFFISVSVVFVFLTIGVFEKRRWS